MEVVELYGMKRRLLQNGANYKKAKKLQISKRLRKTLRLKLKKLKMKNKTFQIRLRLKERKS